MSIDQIRPDASGPLPDGATGRGEGVGEAKEVQGLSQGRIVLRKFLRHRGAMFGVVTLSTIAVFAISAMGLGPVKGWWRWQDPMATHDLANSGGEPTLTLPTWLGGPGFAVGAHPFGQDDIGADYFAQVMEGIVTSLTVMVILSLVAVTIGVTVGSLAGYYRGRLETLLMRFTDLIITLPVLVVGAVLGRMLSTIPSKYFPDDPGLPSRIVSWMPVLLAVALGMITWTGLARLVRSEFLTLREREFVDSARVAGASDVRIITRHILPNAVGVIIVNASLLMSASVVLETALSYLGFGISRPTMSLGNLISFNQGAFLTRPWLFWWPGLFIILIALSANFIGDGLRDAFDPRTKRIPSAAAMRRALGSLPAAGVDPAEAAPAGQPAAAEAATDEDAPDGEVLARHADLPEGRYVLDEPLDDEPTDDEMPSEAPRHAHEPETGASDEPTEEDR